MDAGLAAKIISAGAVAMDISSFFRSFLKKVMSKQLLFLVLLDLSFLVIAALAHTFIVVQALPDLSSINQLVAEESQNVPQIPDPMNVDPNALNFQFPLEQFQAGYSKIMMFAFFYLLAMFVLYNLFFSFTWFRTSLLSGRKQVSYLSYLQRFAVINLLWALLYLGLFYLLILATTATMFGQITLISQGLVDVIGIILGVLLLYFGMVSHTLVMDHTIFQTIKQSFVIGVKKILPLGIGFFCIFLVYFLIMQGISFATPVSVWLAFLVFIFLFVPWVTISRTLFMVLVQDHIKK